MNSGRYGPSKTNNGRKGASASRQSLKKSVRSSGFSPSWPHFAWKNQILWVHAISRVPCFRHPRDRLPSINTNSISSLPVSVLLKAFDDCKVDEGSLLSCRPQNLQDNWRKDEKRQRRSRRCSKEYVHPRDQRHPSNALRIAWGGREKSTG